MTSIFLSAGLAMIEEATLIEDKNQENQNNRYNLSSGLEIALAYFCSFSKYDFCKYCFKV
jgi:hypothetical protein